jgi:c-di-GMP-binding flagellar brake protein YcgR
LVREQQASFQKGDNYLAVDLSDLSAGNYILRLEDGTQTPLVQQIIVK